MRLPRFSVAWALAAVALAALNFGALRGWQSFRAGQHDDPSGRQVTYVDNRFDLLGYGGLPMADLLAVGLMAGLARRRMTPFLLGFEVFGVTALVVFAVSAVLFTEGVLQPCILWVLRSLPKGVHDLHPDLRTFVYYGISMSLVVLPQAAVALAGGFVFASRSPGAPR